MIGKIFTPIVICLFATDLTVSQSYIPLPDSNAIWRMDYGNAFCFDDQLFSEYQYTISNDTIIDSLVYHNLYRSGSFLCDPGQNFRPISGYIGSFRNDTVYQKVFFYHKDSTSEILLYDFTLKIGDTINGYLALFSDNHEAIIDSIDSILIDSTYRIRWHYKASQGYYWDGHIIEGIGCEYGLLEGLATAFENSFTLNCFSHKSKTLFPFPDEAPCELYTWVKENQYLTDIQINIFPNPASSILHIKSSEPLKSFSLYNLNGNLIKSENLNSSGTVNMQNLNKGVYLLKIIDVNNFVHHKLIQHN